MRIRFLKVQILDRLTRKKRVTGLEIINTYRCNARCSFCSLGEMSDLRTDIDPELFKRILSEACREGVVLIVFLGGECLLDKNLYSYLDRCWESGISTALQTNGVMLNEEILLKLKNSHLQSLSITMHDALPEGHDNVYRVQGAFEKATHAIQFAQKIGLEIVLKAIYSKRTANDGSFMRILEMAQKYRLELNVNPFMPVGDGFKDNDRLDIDGVRQYRAMGLREDGVSSHTFNGKEVQGCFAGRDYFCITPDGDVLPCFFLPVSIGNIKDISLREAHRIAMKVPVFEQRLPVCMVAESEPFYQKVIVPLYQNYKELPVDLTKHPEVFDLLCQFNDNNL